MNFLRLVIVFLTNFSRFSNENAADFSRNRVLHPKDENLVLQDVNGSPSSSGPTVQPSKLHLVSLTQDFPNGGSQPMEPAGIQPKLSGIEGEFRAGLQWRSQNEVGWRELNSSSSWWWIKWQQQQLIRGSRQQNNLRWVHRRWRQQPPPPLNQQLFYRWRHQQPKMNSHLQNRGDARRQNSINQENRDNVLHQSQKNQAEDSNNMPQQDKFNLRKIIISRTPNGMVYRDGHLSQNEQWNSALVENQSIQKVGNTLAEKSQNQASNQLNTLGLSNIRNYQEKPQKPLDYRQPKLKQGKQKFDLSSSQLPSTKFQHPVSMSQISVKNQDEESQPKTYNLPASEAEESALSFVSYWRYKKLFTIWKPLSPGFEIFPVMRTHAVKRGNFLFNRHDTAKPLLRGGFQVRSGKQFETLFNSNIQQKNWVFCLNLSCKKIRRKKNKIEFSDQPAITVQQTNSILLEKEKQEYGLYVNEIGPKFTSKTYSNSQGHPTGIKFLKKLQIEKKKTFNENCYSNPHLDQKELSSSNADSNHNGNQLGGKHQLVGSSDETKFVRSLKKRTIDSRGNSPMETDNQRLSNMESLGGPINIDPYDASLQNTEPSKSSVDLELSSNEMEYLFQAISGGIKLLLNKIMGTTR